MLRFMTAGESHGPQLTAMVEGFPAGMAVNVDAINRDLSRRQQGYGRGGRMKIETDRAEIVSGVRFGETIGGPVTLVIRNKDWENWEQRMAPLGKPCGDAVTAARPGHADLTGVGKYGRRDIRDVLERASARETASRVAVGALAKQLLQALGMEVRAHVVEIGGVKAPADPGAIERLRHWEETDLRCMDPETERAMKERIAVAGKDGDTLGGVFEVVVFGCMPGLGSYIQWDRRLDARLAAAMMSIQAIKGVEVGEGFRFASIPGSEAHDEIFCQAGEVLRHTNHAGGLEGGMTNGEPVVLRAAMKPIPTLMKPLASIDIRDGQAVKGNTERSDVCAVSAAAVVGEAMAAIVMAEALIEKFGGDTVTEIVEAVQRYRTRIAIQQ